MRPRSFAGGEGETEFHAFGNHLTNGTTLQLPLSLTRHEWQGEGLG